MIDVHYLKAHWYTVDRQSTSLWGNHDYDQRPKSTKAAAEQWIIIHHFYKVYTGFLMIQINATSSYICKIFQKIKVLVCGFYVIKRWNSRGISYQNSVLFTPIKPICDITLMKIGDTNNTKTLKQPWNILPEFCFIHTYQTNMWHHLDENCDNFYFFPSRLTSLPTTLRILY